MFFPVFLTRSFDSQRRVKGSRFRTCEDVASLSKDSSLIEAYRMFLTLPCSRPRRLAVLRRGPGIIDVLHGPVVASTGIPTST